MIVLGFGNVSEACMWLEVRRLRQCATVQPRTVPSSVGCQRCCLQWETRRAVARTGRRMHRTVRQKERNQRERLFTVVAAKGKASLWYLRFHVLTA